MKISAHLNRALIIASIGLSVSGWAQNVPGEDPVVLTNRVGVQMLPIANGRLSTPINNKNAMPAWLDAKVVRYEAKSNSELATGLATDSDVVRSASSDGFKKTCIQEVGSTTTTQANSAKPPVVNNQQIVVLKGDLVNICK